MQKTQAPKKSSSFLTVVAIFTITILSGYLLPSFIPAVAMEMNKKDNTNTKSIENNAQEQESIFSLLEKEVAKGTNEILDNVFGNTFNIQKKEEKSEWNSQEENNISEKTQKNDQTFSFIEVITGKQLATGYPYQDIENSKFKYSILIGYSNGIFQSNEKFQPKNYVRVSDFIRVVMDTYRLKNPSNLGVLTEKNYFSQSNMPTEVMRRINSAYELWLFQNLESGTLENDTRLKQFITPKQAQTIIENLEKKSPELVNIPQSTLFSSEKVILKEELAEFLVQCFHLKMDTKTVPAFNDISWTTYQDAIQYLADRWIISWIEGNFYPSASVENKDFVSMVIKGLLAKENSPLQLSNFYYLNNLKNVSTNSAYAPYLEYCLDSQVCTPLLSQGSSWVYFQADKILSRGEIEEIFSHLTEITFGIPNERREEPISRGELAYLIYTVFWFDSTKENLVNGENILSLENLKKKLNKIDKKTQEQSWIQLSQVVTSWENNLRYDLRNFMKIS